MLIFLIPTAPTCSTTICFVADYITKHLFVMTKLYGGRMVRFSLPYFAKMVVNKIHLLEDVLKRFDLVTYD